MTQEDKQLLLKDLCARLPYNVMVDYDGNIYVLNEIDPACKDIDYITVRIQDVERLMYAKSIMIENIKPYLRPMSSMTDEEREEWADLFNLELDKLNEIDDENKAEELAPYYFGKSHQVSIDWLNKNMFDYRSLIPMGLALEAKKGMYKIN